MKTSLQALISILSLCTIACHKNASAPEEVQVPIEVSNQRGESVGGSSGGVTFECKSCVMTYPDNSNLPRSGAVFNENEVLVATEPGSSTCGELPDYIRLWYSDEHALTLGVRQVIVKEKTGTTIKNFDITPGTSVAAVASDVKIGADDQSGDWTGNDVAVDGGRPLYPCIYVTDISEDLMSRAGDWQQNTNSKKAVAIAPDMVYGLWKSAVRTVDKTKTPNLVTITVDADPNKSNGWNLAGGKTPPPGTPNEKYGALIQWDVNKVLADGVFQRGHIYRIQFMVHDGDQNKAGGDVGQSCTTIYIPKLVMNTPD
jgi:hypothetical protein